MTSALLLLLACTSLLGPAHAGVGADTALDGAITGDFTVRKYDEATGAELWAYRKSGVPSNNPSDIGKNDICRVVAVDTNGDVYAAGSVWGGAAGPADRSEHGYVVKLNGATGGVIWQRAITEAGNRADRVMDMTLDRSGNVVLACTFAGGPSSGVVKLDGSSGNTLWRNAPGHGALHRVAVDSTNDVLVLGRSNDLGFRNDPFVAKLAAGDGAIRWLENARAHYSNSLSREGDITVDGSDNIIVATHVNGPSLPAEEGVNQFVWKLQPNGSEAWRAQFDRAGGHDGGFGVAVNPGGDVFVIGTTQPQDGGTHDVVTRKLAGTSGDQLWAKTMSDSGFSYDLEIDPSGDVIARGKDVIPGTTRDSHFLRYASTSGSVVCRAKSADRRDANVQNGDSMRLEP